VTDPQPREPRTQRLGLGQELRRIRTLAGLSGRQIAQVTGLSQATVSRIERGESVPSLPEVRAWAEASGVPEDRREVVLGLAEAAVNEVTTFRVRLSGGLAAVQQSVRGLESTARTLRNFQPGIIPGLLQTAEYARRIMTFANTSGDANIGAAVAARLARQEALHDPARTFEFVMTEAALRYRPGPPEVLTAQLDHLAAVATLGTITFGVIPAEAEMHTIVRCGFVLYEDRIDGEAPFVVIETPHASMYANEAADVKLYRDQLARFRESAVFGAAALDIVRSIAHPQ
jgi:transcriptional regulator with XRE-family HTH domain